MIKIKENSATWKPSKYYIADESNKTYLHSDLTWHGITQKEYGSDVYEGYYNSEEEALATLKRWQGSFLGSGEKYIPSLDDVYKGLGLYRETISKDNKEVVVITEKEKISIGDLFYLIAQRWNEGSKEDREEIENHILLQIILMENIEDE